MVLAYTPGAVGSALALRARLTRSVYRFTESKRYVPFDVLSTGEEGTRIPGDPIRVRCTRCRMPVTMRAGARLEVVVDALARGKHVGHKKGRCKPPAPATAEPPES